MSSPTDTLKYTLFKTPLGKTGVAVSPAGICRVVLSVSRESEFVELLKKIHPYPQKQSGQLMTIEKEFHQYFNGKLKNFSFKPDLSQGTHFQQSIWKKLTTIPCGKTKSYQWLASAIGKPQASRAAGNANGRNPVPVIVPCHRVIRQNGALGGYTGGIHLKKFLLDLEK